uniref:Uncharacterized protein n=1 Tax=Arundo donax TaxID=35708 RepID=A0A0A9D5H7_ARUDO
MLIFLRHLRLFVVMAPCHHQGGHLSTFSLHSSLEPIHTKWLDSSIETCTLEFDISGQLVN